MQEKNLDLLARGQSEGVLHGLLAEPEKSVGMRMCWNMAHLRAYRIRRMLAGAATAGSCVIGWCSHLRATASGALAARASGSLLLSFSLTSKKAYQIPSTDVVSNKTGTVQKPFPL